jgi:uncharacterized membrane protein
MADQKWNNYNWFTGTKRSEVIRSLEDRQPTRLREQGVRRQIVGLYLLVLAMIPGAFLIHHYGLLDRFGRDSALVGMILQMLFVTGIVSLYYMLRRSVRHISEAKAEWLDERMVELRDAAHYTAYKILAVAVCLLGFSLQFFNNPRTERRFLVTTLSLTFTFLAMALPALVLAWRLPTERD